MSKESQALRSRPGHESGPWKAPPKRVSTFSLFHFQLSNFRVGNLAFSAPELFLHRKYGRGADIYSLALTMYYCYYGQWVFTPFSILNCPFPGSRSLRVSSPRDTSAQPPPRCSSTTESVLLYLGRRSTASSNGNFVLWKRENWKCLDVGWENRVAGLRLGKSWPPSMARRGGSGSQGSPIDL